MEYEKLRKRAEKKVKAKKSFIVIATIYGVISFLLIVLSLKIGGEAAFWIRFPILVFMAVLTIIYVSIYGIPGSTYWNEELREQDVSREMQKLQTASHESLELPREYSYSSYQDEDFV